MNKKAQQRRDTTTGATQKKTKQKLVVEREQAQKKNLSQISFSWTAIIKTK